MPPKNTRISAEKAVRNILQFVEGDDKSDSDSDSDFENDLDRVCGPETGKHYFVSTYKL